MPAKTVKIELEVEAAQELASTAETTANKIDWVLENRKPTKKGQAEALDERAKLLTKTATLIKQALHERAKANEKDNVVKIASKK
jgi:hypothetical protein